MLRKVQFVVPLHKRGRCCEAGWYRNKGPDAIEKEKYNGVQRSQNDFVRPISTHSASVYTVWMFGGGKLECVYNKITCRYRCGCAHLNLGR